MRFAPYCGTKGEHLCETNWPRPPARESRPARLNRSEKKAEQRIVSRAFKAPCQASEVLRLPRARLLPPPGRPAHCPRAYPGLVRGTAGRIAGGPPVKASHAVKYADQGPRNNRQSGSVGAPTSEQMLAPNSTFGNWTLPHGEQDGHARLSDRLRRPAVSMKQQERRPADPGAFPPRLLIRYV
jgi:hypothetical protein